MASTSAMIQLRTQRRDGRRILRVVVPRRVFTLMRASSVDAVELSFGPFESFEVGAEELSRAITETREKRGTRCSGR